MKWYAAVAALPISAALFAASGYDTCSIPAKGRVDQAYQETCLLILAPDCARPPCAVRNCVVAPEVTRCPDGSIPMHHAASIEAYTAKELKPFTPEERALMNHNIDAAAKELAKKWSPNGRGLTPEQMTAIRNQACLIVAATNPDMRCCPASGCN
jgi:hypothetical protein